MYISYFFRFFLSLCIILTPRFAFAASDWTVTRSTPSFVSGQLKATYTFRNAVSGLQRTATAILTRAEIGALARYVMSKRVAGFSALTAAVGGLGYVVYDTNAVPNVYKALSGSTALGLPHLTASDQKPFTLVPSWTAATAPRWCDYAFSYYNSAPDFAGHRPYVKATDTNWCAYNSGNSALTIYLDEPNGYRNTFAFGPSTFPIDDFKPYPPVLIDTASGTSQATDIANVSNVALGADVSGLAISTLSPLMDYTSDYQSPAAARALASVQSAYPADNIVLDYPIDTPSKVGIPPSMVTGTSFETSTTYPVSTTDTGTGTNTGTSSGSFDLPSFCDWATGVCDAIAWFQDDPELPEPEKAEISKGRITDLPELSNVDLDGDYIQFTSQCPPDYVFSIMGHSYSIKYDLICQLASNMRPYIIGFSYLGAAMIVSGIRGGD